MTNTAADLDTVIGLAIVEILVNPEHSFEWLRELAESEGIELTEAQGTYLDETVTRTLDQLAIPFIESLPEGERERYRAILERRSAS